MSPKKQPPVVPPPTVEVDVPKSLCLYLNVVRTRMQTVGLKEIEFENVHVELK